MSGLEILLLCVVIAVVSFGIVRWLLQKDTEIEDRRRAAARLAGVLTRLGLKRTPAFLIDYSVGDYSGMAVRIKQLAELFTDGEDAVVAEFENVFDSCLTMRLKTEAGRAYVASRLSDASRPDDPVVVRDAPVAEVALVD